MWWFVYAPNMLNLKKTRLAVHSMYCIDEAAVNTRLRGEIPQKLLLCRETSLADFAVLALQIRPPQIFCILNFKAVVKILKFQICLHSCLTLGPVESKGRD